ncbi:MAG: hypothetical protein M3R17_18280 [Bacteroidota bacterium]|nr:hypothetical protein [Bacteroidota bacterium]
MKSFLTAISLFFTISLFAQQKSPSDTLTPLQVVERYVSPGGFPNKLKFFCCELYGEWNADSTLGQYLPKRVQRTSELIFQDTAHAMVAVWLHDTTTSLDIYFYLVKAQNWTIYAARSLVMKQSAKDALKSLDSIPEKDRGEAYTKTHAHTYYFETKNLELWDNSDDVLAAHFIEHKKQFQQIQKRLVKKGFTKTDSLVINAIKDKKIKKLTNEILIRGFEYDKRYPGCIFYLIGGIADNTVGYLYQPDGKKIPLITEKHYILIKPLGDGWYLFKTT